MSSYTTKKTPGDTSWFTRDRFGMFIHWGLYAMPARHEWVKSYEMMSEEDYEKYFQFFDPDMYDAREWARMAKAAGMKYAVMTTKHHDGFCLFDSKYTDYKSTNTPARRDLIREFVDAFRAEGLKIGFYYSLIDWHHPEFTIDVLHPRREDKDAFDVNSKRDMKVYVEYMHNQVKELLTGYGEISYLFFDYSYTEYKPKEGYEWQRGKGRDDWESERLIETVRSIAPNILINSRADIDQDVWAPEQYQPLEWLKHKKTNELLTWEAVHTFSGSWGYHRDEMTWKSPVQLIRLLIDSVALGGNLMMNAGPTARGFFDERAVSALDVYAKWMKYNNKSIYGCTMAEPEFTPPVDCRYTQSNTGDHLYLHLTSYPHKFVELPGMADKVAYAQFLHDGSEVKMVTPHNSVNNNFTYLERERDYPDNFLALRVPDVKPDVIVPVIELILK